ncbi:MAG TPA: hypothetical protein VGF40_07515 [Thermoanaerobaculia bacterium]
MTRTRILLASLLFAVGCATSAVVAPEGFYGPMPLATPFWDAPPRPVGVLLLEAPEGGVYNLDESGNVYDWVPGGAYDRPLVDFVKSTATDFEWLAGEMSALLAERGLSVARLDASAVDRDVMAADATFEQMTLKYDEVASAAGASELVLVITPASWGFSRTYSGGLPASRRSAFFEIDGILVDVTNRAILWEGYAAESVLLPLAWSLRQGGHEVPDEAVLQAALKDAMAKAGDALVRDLAEWDGAEASLVWVGER